MPHPLLAPAPPGAAGFHKPTTTPVPDELFDEWLAVLSGAELKCLLYIVRRTLGFKKEADAISLSQMVHGITTRDGRVLDRGTGLNRSTVVEALASLEARGLIEVVRAAEAGVALTSTYALRWRSPAGAPADGSRPSPPAPDRPPDPPAPRRGARPALSPAGDKAGRQKPDGVVGFPDHAARAPSAVVGLSNQGSRKKQPGWSENPPRVVGKSNSQQTVQQTASNKPDSNPPTPEKDFAPVPYSPYIAGVVLDHARELGDGAQGPSDVTRALRIWQRSALAESLFVSRLHEARARVRTAQGQQGRGQVWNKMGYYFAVLEDLLTVAAS